MSETNTGSPLRQRMIEDMAARKLNPHTQRSHIYSCKRFAAWLKRSPDTAIWRPRCSTSRSRRSCRRC
jgi:integrase/recombinase XerD